MENIAKFGPLSSFDVRNCAADFAPAPSRSASGDRGELLGCQPPTNNMGAENTTELPQDNRSLIDWLAWTVKVTDPHEAITLCGLDDFDFIACDFGGMGYRSSMRSGNIVVFYDGAPNMGCHFSMTGQGCRQFEAQRKSADNGLAWYRLLHHLRSIDAGFARVDIAVDNVDGALDLGKLESAIRSQAVQSRFRGAKLIEQFALSRKNHDLGKTIYLGSSSSRIKFRFYDKAAQLGLCGHWVRFEMQCMGERASEAVSQLLRRVAVGTLAVGVLNNYFRPINPDDSNKSRCSTQEWWASWLATTEKIRLTIAKAMKYIQDKIQDFKRQFAPTLATFKTFLGVAGFSDFLADTLSNGKSRMTRKHENLIACSYLAFESDLPF